MNDPEKPLIFDIHHFALDDGPGIRTSVFFKGCPLSCGWCHNPESIDFGPQIAFYPSLCINCGDCLTICPLGAIREGTEKIDRRKCSNCGKCADICPSTAIKTIGRYYPVPVLLENILSDSVFYSTSGGGVTFTGGEPAMYTGYLEKIMKELKKNNIHIAIQTSGMFDIDRFKAKLLPYMDLIYFDIKFIDMEMHKKYTGVDNRKILGNFIDLVKTRSVKIIPGTPLVPSIVAVPDNLIQIAGFLKKTACEEYQLLTYNTGGISKRISLGLKKQDDIPDYIPGIEKEKEWKGIFKKTFSTL